MRNPAHKIDDGGWCDKPKDTTPAPPPPPPLAAQAAEVARDRTPMPLNTAMAPHGVCPEHKAVLVPIGNTGKKGHWRTVNGNRIVCELAPMPGLDQQANDKQGDLGWGGMAPATAENTRGVGRGHELPPPPQRLRRLRSLRRAAHRKVVGRLVLRPARLPR